ncbi:hypothetical protein [Nocardia brasiliensis]|uniref:hypothetical protein n=1 Tax=Nocardia brasiliensis TaxID=37326 RepID=UPI002457499C|nr:hypothetical protein [Nocardia brasiliensis]
MTSSGGSAGKSRGLDLDAVRWHIGREDQLRAAVSTRAGAVLSTNALVIAGTALSFSFRDARRPNLTMLCTTLGALLFVAGSVIFASMALITLRRTDRQFFGPREDASAVYYYTGISDQWSTFDAFRESVMNQSQEQQFRGALVELWRAANLHRYRYRKLRTAAWLLLGALGMLLVTVWIAAVAP